MYADVSTIHISGTNIQELQAKVKDDLYCVDKWCEDTCMFINSNKTKCMIIGTRQHILFQQHESCLTICSDILQNTSCEKLLGIKIDPQLNWASHVDVCSKTFITNLSPFKNQVIFKYRIK